MNISETYGGKLVLSPGVAGTVGPMLCVQTDDVGIG